MERLATPLEELIHGLKRLALTRRGTRLLLLGLSPPSFFYHARVLQHWR